MHAKSNISVPKERNKMGIFVVVLIIGYIVLETKAVFMYMTEKQTSEKWDISDRRVRILCSEGMFLFEYYKIIDCGT